MAARRRIRKFILQYTAVLFLANCACESHAVPRIIITNLPAYGSTDNLAGVVLGVDPAAFRVAVFIDVPPYGWYSKPTCAQALTPIQPDGSWSADITTGGADTNATRIAALLVVNAARPGNQHVEVADRLPSTAQRTGGRDLLDPFDVPQVLGQLLRSAIGFVEQEAPRNAAVTLNRFQDFLLALFAQTRQFAELAFARQLLHAGEIADLEGAPK